MRITVNDVRAAGHCTGVPARRWFRNYGLDHRAFLRDGIAAADLLATGDAIACHVVERAIVRLYPDTSIAAATGNPDALIALVAELESLHG